MKIKRGNPPAQDTSVRATFLAGNGFFCEDSRPFCPLCGHSPNGGALEKGG